MLYKTAVIGCGRIGFAFDEDPKRRYIATHAGAYRFVKDTELVAACDANKEALHACVNKLRIPAGYTDFKKMLKNEKIDIVSICTPPHTHYSILKEAIKFPIRAVFCEKPLTDEVRDARKIIDLYKKKKIILQIGHQRRFDPLHAKVKKIIQSGSLGKVQQANFYYTAGLKNTGSHMFDLLRFLFGDVKWLEGFYSRNSSHNEDDPNIDGVMGFRNGTFATFQACDAKKYLIFELNCFLEKGRLIIKDSGFSIDFYTPGQSKYYTGYRELYKRRPRVNTVYKRDFMVNAVKHLMKCIQDKKEPVSSGRDGLAAVELIAAAFDSAKANGKKVLLR